MVFWEKVCTFMINESYIHVNNQTGSDGNGMRSRDVVMWGAALVIFSTLSISLILGLIREKIDERYVFNMSAIHNRDNKQDRSTVKITFGNYWIGSWGEAVQISIDGNARYKIHFNRYLNILPVVVQEERMKSVDKGRPHID